MTTTDSFSMAADLGPADAPSCREALLAWLRSPADGAVLELGAEAEAPSACALQLLAATSRSPLFTSRRTGPRATAALAALHATQSVKESAR
ncbi:hypothetical protein [Roseitranquillus sediminis]|uniref:hypothetical protein n=1 Tax=Roseitranquillus sediminis TaxID=2809051 RepID=UPI001D0C14D4|nr:hypothetical protein [Roseitranquillus sediminis]MBM9593596.1 hypothetical protein [Roseitranquillus sediminis]